MVFEGHRKVSHHDGSTQEAWFPLKCGHCGKDVSGAVLTSYRGIRWLLCPICGDGSVLDLSGNIHPGVPFGPTIQGLPDDTLAAYDEARRCMSVSAFTACELLCRKILMHVAVEKGAKEGESFSFYLSHLEKAGFVTPPMKGWVDLIREHGNQAAHTLEKPSKQRSESTLMFTAELLRLVYEMEYLSKQYAARPTSP